MQILAILLVFFVIIALVGVIVYQNYYFSIERQRLLDRIMSKTYTEYRGYSDEPEENHLSDETDNLLDIESARSELQDIKE